MRTREKIEEAAISLFLQQGYVGTSIADIRELSGATTGSIYHYFASKAGIAIHLWDKAIAGWSQRFQALGAPQSAQAQIEATVRSLLEWARSHPEHFRVYDEILFLARTLEEFGPILKRIEEGHAISAQMYAHWAKAGEVVKMPWHVARALMMGPSLELLRSGRSFKRTEIDRLSNKAWVSVQA